MDDLCVPLCPLQHGAQRSERGNCVHPRRADSADPKFLQPLHPVRSQSGIHGACPNYRGSTGYGKEFQQANLFDMGGGDLQDILAGVDWIKQTGHLDPKKIAVMGASYGGYLSMMAVTKAPEVWAAGIPIVPFVNWLTE